MLENQMTADSLYLFLAKHWTRYAAIVLLALTAGFLLYGDSIAYVISIVLGREESSHGIFVPILFVVLIRHNIKAIKSCLIQYDYLGLPFLLLGIAIPLSRLDIPELDFIGYLVFISGVVILLAGRKLYRQLAFPIFFLITMVPIPKSIYEQIANLLRETAMSGSLYILSILNVPHFRDGWNVQLNNTVLRVAVSCSGIRYLISYFVFGLVYAYLYKVKKIEKIITSLLTIPLSISASILRLALIFLAAHYISPKMADYWPHVIISWVVFALVLLVGLMIDRELLRNKFTKANDIQMK